MSRDFLHEKCYTKPKGYSRHRLVSLITSCETPSPARASDQSPRHNVPAEPFAATSDAADGSVCPPPPAPSTKSRN